MKIVVTMNNGIEYIHSNNHYNDIKDFVNDNFNDNKMKEINFDDKSIFINPLSVSSVEEADKTFNQKEAKDVLEGIPMLKN